MSNVDYLSTAIEIAHEAGKVLEHHHDKAVSFEYKDDYDLVTSADRASEKLIVEQLRQRFPAHSIVAEEGGNVNNSSEFVWYVDPLDGTTNFAHGFPAFAVSMGLARKNELIAGVVYDPIRSELFSAEKGSGAYLNNRRIHISTAASLAESLLATGFASRRHIDINVYFFHQVSMLSHGIRRAGSAALDLCSVAAGHLDGFWEFGLKTWDVAAGLLIVTEAGGRYGNMKGGPYELGGEHLAVTNGAVHEELLQLFADMFQGRYKVPIKPIGPHTE